MELDVAVVGAGPAGLSCAALIAEKGNNVGIIEKKLSIGGGMLLSGEHAATLVLKNLKR